MQDFQALRCWIITEGLAGTENQCLGVADALGVHADVRRIRLAQPWRLLSPYMGAESALTFSPRLEPPWPDLLITSGRKSIAASRYIRKASGGKTFTVHIQDPRTSRKQFDLLAVAEHDPIRGENVLITKAAPNRITDIGLELARQKFRHLESIGTPRVAVLIGGSSRVYDMTPVVTERLARQLADLQAGLMITTSRRTGVENERRLRAALKGKPHYFWDGQGENPYAGMLAWADAILVTADSVSMLSEAATTGKPVYMIELEGGGRRLSALHETLLKAGILRRFDGTIEDWNYEPLRDAERVAQEIRRRMERGGWIQAAGRSI